MGKIIENAKVYKRVSAFDFNGEAEDGEFGVELSILFLENGLVIDEEPFEITFFETKGMQEEYINGVSGDHKDFSLYF